MEINPQKPVIRLLAIASSGFLVFGAVLDSISNSISIITPLLTYILTPVIVLGAWFAHYYLRKYPLKIPKSDEITEVITGLNLKTIGAIIGVVILLWIPRFFGSANQIPPQSSEIQSNNKTSKKSTPSNYEINEKSVFSKKYYPKSRKNNASSVSISASFSRNDSDFLLLTKLEIYQNKSAMPFQTIEFVEGEIIYTDLNFNYNEDIIIIIEDINFDGADDFRILSDIGSGGTSYNCYLYDRDGTYRKSESFNAIYNRSAVRLDRENKIIEVSRRCTIAEEENKKIYEIKGHEEVRLIKETTCTE